MASRYGRHGGVSKPALGGQGLGGFDSLAVCDNATPLLRGWTGDDCVDTVTLQRPVNIGARRWAAAATPSRKSAVACSRVCSSSSRTVAAATASASPARMVARMLVSAKGAEAAIRSANRIAAGRTPPSAANSSTNPAAWASSPPKR